MEFTVKQLQEFGRCPLKYKFGFADDLRYRKDRDEELADSLKSATTWFFDKVEMGVPPTKRMLRQKWGKIWHDGKNVYDILFDTSYKYERRRNIKGIKVLDKFYDRFIEDPGIIILNNYPFEVPIKGGHILKGRFDVVREIDDGTNKKLELMNFRSDKYAPQLRVKERDLLLTMHDYAFRKTFEQIPDQLAYYAFKNDRLEAISPMDEKRFARMEAMVNNIASIVEQELYYPRFDEKHYMCRHCDYSTPCSRWR